MTHLITNRTLQVFGFVLTVCFAFILFVVFQTVYPYEMPVKYGTGLVRAWVGPYSNVTLSYVRPVMPVRDVKNVMLYRAIECNVDGGKQVYDLQPLRRSYTVIAPQNVNRLVQYPYPLAIGTECVMKTQVVWSPEFAWSAHSEWLPEVKFVIDAVFHDVRDDQRELEEK